MQKYNPEFDYVSAHLAWVKKHVNFVPKQQMTTIKFGNHYFDKPTYTDFLTEMYSIETYGDDDFDFDAAKSRKNKLAFINLNDDINWQKNYFDIVDSLSLTSKVPVAFLTISFHHGSFTIQKALQLINSLLNQSFVKDGSFAVLERYKSDGIHPHVHVKLYFDKSKSKSQIIQHVLRLKNAKDLIRGQNFVDFKNFEPRHDLYLEGKKTEEKMQFVNMDILWREENNIPHKLFKEMK